MGLLSLCHLVTLPPSLGAEAPSPERLGVDALCQARPARGLLSIAQPSVDDVQTRAWRLLEPAARALPEGLRTDDCRYVGFQTEWVASKRDMGLPLSETLRLARRVFALDPPWHTAVAGVLGPLVYCAPQHSPAALRQTMEAACRAHLRLEADPAEDW